ncbi:MAG TPA: tetratricopeptide repeat protein [Fimbriimonadaceae bacterium]|nr:tetratricopeptide repeat protein [Fimbriimonadaceae bacterium]
MDVPASQDLRAGIQLYMNQDYAGAETQLSEAVKIRPDWAEGWSYLGFSLYMQQKLTEAAPCLEKAVMMDQENPEARFGLGLVWAAMKRVDAAIACWNETLRLNPNHADAKRSLVGALIYRAQTYFADKDYDRGEGDLDRAIKIDRTAPQPVVILTNHFIEQNMTARAQKTVKDAIAYMPNDGNVQALAIKLNVQADKDTQVLAQDQQARQQVQRSQEVPCPACKRPVMEWAAICPHCNTQIKALPSQFAGRMDALPKVVWQDIAYYVVAALLTLQAVIPLVITMATKGPDQLFTGFAGVANVVNLVTALLGIGLLFKVDLIMYITKILCYINGFFLILGTFLAFFAGFYVAATIEFGQLSIVGFMIYLLNYHGAGE